MTKFPLSANWSSSMLTLNLTSANNVRCMHGTDGSDGTERSENMQAVKIMALFGNEHNPSRAN